MSIFVNSGETFPIKLRFQYKHNESKQVIGIKVLGDDVDTVEREQSIVCEVKGRDYDSMSRVLEEATIINHISGKPMIRARVFYKLILLNFFMKWNFIDNDGNMIAINNENIGKMHYSLVKALARKWLNETDGK